MEKHKSVLLDEAISYLNIRDDGVYVDATLGFAGHSSNILRRVPKGFLIAFDKDINAISYSKEKLSKIGDNFYIFNTGFINIKKCVQEKYQSVDGILFDIGVSSAEIDEGDRGFSYMNDGLLDMRMDLGSKLSAYDVVNSYDYKELVRVIKEYGEEKYASSIAKNICKYREKKNIETTLELVDIIKSSMQYKAMRDTHPARRTFQAIRIEVNHELDVLKIALKDALDLLNVGGRLCVISFQSLEDKIVKKMFLEYSSVSDELKKLPYIPDEYKPKYRIVGKSITASDDELKDNHRAQSARLRVIERVCE